MDDMSRAFCPYWPDKHACTGITQLESMLQKPPYSLLPKGSALPPVMPDLAPIMPWGPAIDGTDSGLRGLPIHLLQATYVAKNRIDPSFDIHLVLWAQKTICLFRGLSYSVILAERKGKLRPNDHGE